MYSEEPSQEETDDQLCPRPETRQVQRRRMRLTQQQSDLQTTNILIFTRPHSTEQPSQNLVNEPFPFPADPTSPDSSPNLPSPFLDRPSRPPQYPETEGEQ